MDFLTLANKRRSVRAYAEQPVEREKLNRCIEAARLTPSACNSQPWEFLVVEDRELSRQVAEATREPISGMNKWAVQAPVIIAVLTGKRNLSSQVGALLKRKPFWLMDVGMAAEHLCLQAAEEGLGTCMLGWFNEKRIKTLLNLPRTKDIALIITLGYPRFEDQEREHKKIRHPFGDVVRYIS